MEEDYVTGGLKYGPRISNTGGKDVVVDAALLENNYGWEGVTTISLTGAPKITNSSTRGSLFGIYEKCENKERAYEFLKLWNTDPEVKNAFYLGIPDTHYTVVDGKAQRADNWEDLYYSRNWTTGNNVIAMLTVDEDDDMWEENLAAAESARETADLGMFLDPTSISEQQATVDAVLSEYLSPVILGFVEPETGIQQLNEQLKAAGLEDIIAEIQAQYDEFVATK